MNAERTNDASEPVGQFRTEELPGAARLFIQLPGAAVQGQAVVDALKLVSVDVAHVESAKNDSQFNVLTVNELQAFASKLQVLLPVLGEWYEAIYTQMWQNEQYSEILVRSVFRGLQDSNPGAREFKNFAISVFCLMHTATQAVDEYAFNVLEALVAYGQACATEYSV